MAEGEELPPVVAVLAGDDSNFLAMLERDIQAAREAGVAIEEALTEGMGGVTFSGSSIATEGIGAAGEVIGEQFAAGFEEGAAGLNLGAEMQGAGADAAGVGQGAGGEFASGFAEGAAAAGDGVAQEIAGPLAAGMAEAGAAAGDAFDAGLVASTATVGEVLARQISEQLRLGLDEAAQASMGVLGSINASGFASTLASSVTGAAFLAGLPAAARSAALVAGGALSDGLAEGAAGAGDHLAVQIGGELRSRLADGAVEASALLSDALLEGAVGVGDALAGQVGAEMQAGVAVAGEHAGEVLKEGILEGAAGVGDVLGAEIGADVSFSTFEGLGGTGARAAQEISAELTAGLEGAGAAAGTALSEEILARTETVGEVVGRQFTMQLLQGMDEAAEATRAVMREISSSGFSTMPASSPQGAAFLGGLAGAGSQVSAAGLESTLAGMSQSDFFAFTARLGAQVQAQGEEAGVRYVAGLQQGISSMSDWRLGPQPLPSDMPQAPNPFVENPVAPGQMVRETRAADLAAEAQAAAAQAEQAFTDAVQSARVSPQAFASMTDEGLAQWREEVETQAAVTGRGFTDAFAEAMRADMTSIDWASLTEGQAAALEESLRGELGRTGEETGMIFGAEFQQALASIGETGPAAAGHATGEAFGAALDESQPGIVDRFTAYWGDAFAQVWDIAAGPQITDALASLGSNVAQQASARTHRFVDFWAQAFGQVDEIVAGPQIREALGELTIDAEAQVESMRATIATGLSGFWSDVQATADGLMGVFSRSGQQAGEAFDSALQQSFSQVSVQGGFQERLLAQNAVAEEQMAAGAAGAATEINKVGSAAAGATGALGGMAGVMAGPAGMLLYSLPMVLPMIAQSFSSSAINAATFTQAVQQDSNAVGDNTAVTIQNALAKTDLNSMAQVLGVTQAQLIEYAAGEADAQNQVAAAYKRVYDYQQQNTSGNALPGLQAQKAQLDQVTASVQQAIEANRENSDTLLAAEQTTQIYDASVAGLVTNLKLQAEQAHMSASALDIFLATTTAGSQAFTNSVRDQEVALRQQAQQTQISALAALGLSDGQAAANTQLAASLGAYSEATTGANAYNAVLQAANGSINNLLSSEASFTVALDGVTKAAQNNGTSLDVNNAKGAQNVQVFTQIVQAADKAAVAMFQNDVDTGHAAFAFQDATNKLQQEKTAFEQAAEKAGFQKQQVQEPADELFHLPPDVQVGANVSPLLNAVSGVLQRIDNSGLRAGLCVGKRLAGRRSSPPAQP